MMDQYIFSFQYLFAVGLVAVGLGLPSVCVLAYNVDELDSWNSLNTHKNTCREEWPCFTETGNCEADGAKTLPATGAVNQLEIDRNHSPPLILAENPSGFT